MDWDTTQNLYIEGDNLEVLKLLQKSYAGKIKVIYADPPYNTGNDILYKNDFSDNLSSYLKLTGQFNENKDVLFTNTESNGRYHSKWLSMMYSRIKLSKNLLTNDGFFVIAIDHNELQNLIKICDEIFGENNRAGVVTVLSNPMGRQHGKYFTPTNEFMLVYAKNKDYGNLNKVILHEDDMKSFDMCDSKGKYKLEPFIRIGGGNPSLRINKPKAWYPLYVNLEQKDISLTPKPKYQQVFPITPSGQERTWLWVKDSPKIDTNELLPQMNDNGKIEVYRKYRVEEGKMVSTVWKHKKYNANHHGSRDLEKDMDEKKIFSYPKSKNLLIDIFKITASENSLIMDIFSGSSTSAKSILELNLKDNSKRKFIQVQLPEPTNETSQAYKAGYKTIAEIGKDRIRKVVKKIKKENPEKYKNMDLGFKVFKLDSSNIKSWDGKLSKVKESIENAMEKIKSCRTKEDVLYEMLLRYGLDLTLPIEKRDMAGKTVYNAGSGSLFFCWEDNITREIAQGIGQWKKEYNPENCRVIFKDNGFSDAEKTNSLLILNRFKITEIDCI